MFTTSDARIDALSVLEFTNVVVRELPPHRTTDVDTNPLPDTVNTNAPLDAVTTEGLVELTVGTGFSTLNGRDPEVPPPGCGLVTVIWTVLALATSDAEMDARTVVEFTYVVVRELPFQ